MYPSEGSIPQPEIAHDDLKKTESQSPAPPEIKKQAESNGEPEVTSKNQEPDVSSPKAPSEAAKSSSHHEEVKATEPPIVPQNQQLEENLKNVQNSQSSIGYSEAAGDYVGGMINNLMEGYSDIVKANNQASNQEDSISYNKNSCNQSIEKRVDVDSSIEAGQSSQGGGNGSELPFDDMNKSTSTIRNIANDYVSDMVNKLA